jgi:phosphatidylglycerophosphatase A
MAGEASEAKLPSWPVVLVATSFGSGFSPFAPGTCGTLTAIPMAWAAARLGSLGFTLVTVAICIVGTIAAELFVRATGREDDQRIVVDEVAGYFVTLLFVPRTPIHFVLAFLLFRLFDIWKPPPVRFIDDSVGGGLGVMADDFAAGVYAALILGLLYRFGVTAHLASWVHL